MKILIAVDGSPDSMEAVKAIGRLTEKTPSQILLATVVNPPEVPIDASADLWVPQLLQQQEELAASTLDNAAAMLAGHDHVTTKTCTGHVTHSILDTADEYGADLIVIGAVGHSAVARIVLGSVSDDVATHAKQSVLVYRRSEGFAAGGNDLRVTVAYDGSDSSEKALVDFANVDWSGDAIVNVVSVASRLEMFGQEITPAAIEESAKRRTDAKRLAVVGAERLKKHVATVAATMMESDHLGEGIMKAAAEHNSGLIVVGDKGHGFVARLLMGSTSRYVLRHATQSVLIAR
ncbi:universal stress protein [Crateriforma conspicua]|uniref:Universal stress protein n=1 Tax=Crateriforma conspicua TaxID=2527996 RepID=A0A5C6FMX4_9PLAN|nr:universal stress protein [Crateriforma conspicua]TWU61886.1 Universal stress protein [Crateriforma conspicua]